MKTDSVMFLLGAGASVDATIPMAIQMLGKIEDLIRDDERLQNLYYYLKSAILYQRGLEGDFNRKVGVEDLLGVIEELSQKHRNRLYPFVGAWSPHLINVANPDFSNIKRLDELIRSNLVDWVQPKNGSKEGAYFQKLEEFRGAYGRSISIFTLNYDLLVERNLVQMGCLVETGFDSSDRWNASRFERNDYDQVNFYLYKLHGSIDWEREVDEKDDCLKKRENPVKNPDLIFGVNNKLNSGDPYLFYVHELRRHTLESATKLIFVIGYSFSDQYINKLLSQALRSDSTKRIINVSPDADSRNSEIITELRMEQNPSAIVPLSTTAKEFFENKLTIELCQNSIVVGSETPF